MTAWQENQCTREQVLGHCSYDNLGSTAFSLWSFNQSNDFGSTMGSTAISLGSFNQSNDFGSTCF